jgi:hypothetical protein
MNYKIKQTLWPSNSNWIHVHTRGNGQVGTSTNRSNLSGGHRWFMLQQNIQLCRAAVDRRGCWKHHSSAYIETRTRHQVRRDGRMLRCLLERGLRGLLHHVRRSDVLPGVRRLRAVLLHHVLLEAGGHVHSAELRRLWPSSLAASGDRRGAGQDAAAHSSAGRGCRASSASRDEGLNSSELLLKDASVIRSTKWIAYTASLGTLVVQRGRC